MYHSNRATLSKTTISDIEFVAKNMRKEDIREVEVSGLKPIDSLLEDFKSSDQVLTLNVDGNPALIFGVGPCPVDENNGIIWALGTNAIFTVPMYMVKKGIEVVKLFSEEYNTLYNMVDSRNEASVRWLSLIGFNVNKSEPVVLKGIDFYPFYFVGDF